MFTETFNELLEEHGLNRKQFADKSGIPYTTVIGWTTLGRLPDYTAMCRIADFFGCSLDYVAGRHGEYDDGRNAVNVSAAERKLISKYRKLRTDDKELVIKLINAIERDADETDKQLDG